MDSIESTPTPSVPPTETSPTATPAVVVGRGSRKPAAIILLVIALFVIILAIVAAGFWLLGRQSANKYVAQNTAAQTQTTSKSPHTTSSLPGLQLDTSKNYGDAYNDGILPVGDGKYTTSAAKKGYVYACSTYAQNLASGGGGADTRGPWFATNNTEYNINKKIHVTGTVTWQGSFTNTRNGTTRTIATNDLPSHTTGIFPILSSDPAYAYDRNPNSIKAQNLTYTLNASPEYGDPNCMGGQVGIMLTGVAIFNAFDAGGRDAGAWEVQDACSGHPEKSGEYHYHTLSSCIKDTSVSTVIGFALDGFPITGPKVGPQNILTTNDLDECHGITSDVTLDGKKVTMYHYVMTQDFPYSVSCFRATAIQPPGLQTPARP